MTLWPPSAVFAARARAWNPRAGSSYYSTEPVQRYTGVVGSGPPAGIDGRDVSRETCRSREADGAADTPTPRGSDDGLRGPVGPRPTLCGAAGGYRRRAGNPRTPRDRSPLGPPSIELRSRGRTPGTGRPRCRYR